MKNKLIKRRNHFYRSLLSSKILAIAVAIRDGGRNWRLYSSSARTEAQTEPMARRSRPTKPKGHFSRKIDRKCCNLNWSNRRFLHKTSGTLFHSARTHTAGHTINKARRAKLFHLNKLFRLLLDRIEHCRFVLLFVSDNSKSENNSFMTRS